MSGLAGVEVVVTVCVGNDNVSSFNGDAEASTTFTVSPVTESPSLLTLVDTGVIGTADGNVIAANNDSIPGDALAAVGTELIFIDTATPNYNTLVEGLSSKADPHTTLRSS